MEELLERKIKRRTVPVADLLFALFCGGTVKTWNNMWPRNTNTSQSVCDLTFRQVIFIVAAHLCYSKQGGWVSRASSEQSQCLGL